MLTKEQILDAAEDVLRRFGPRKTTVVDVARALDVSHGTVYRHYESKAALHEAITTRWIERVTLPLADIAQQSTPVAARLRQWFETLMEIKRRNVKDDPEMFESYSILAKNVSSEMRNNHIDIMLRQIEDILREGAEQGIFDVENCAVTANVLFEATLRYHHPLHVREWQGDNIADEFNALYALLEKAILKHD